MARMRTLPVRHECAGLPFNQAMPLNIKPAVGEGGASQLHQGTVTQANHVRNFISCVEFTLLNFDVNVTSAGDGHTLELAV